MLIVDGNGSILFANRQVSAVFGYSHDEVIGLPIEYLMPARFGSRHVGHRLRYLANAHVRPMGAGLDLYARRRDGTEFPVEISLSPIESDGQRLVAAAIRDVTDRKHTEAELIVARDSAQRAREIAVEASISADRANQGKSQFLATASHDLRQPLQTLALLNRTLRGLLSDPRAGEALAQQEHAITAMSRLLNALLDISKLESGAIKPEPTDFVVSQLFAELRDEFAALAADKGLDLHVEVCADRVHSDPSLVEEMLRNLLANAIKYTPQGWVKLRCLHEAPCVRLEVLDTGIGIPADQIPYIFDEFYQVGIPPQSSRHGYGLGLSIVQRIAKLLNAPLDVRSEPGRGSAFAVTLPAGAGPAPLSARNSEAPRSREIKIRKAHVLLVEDDPGVRRATRLLLSIEGYKVTATASLEEAVQAARADEGIELLITDYHLQSGDTGLDVISSLREVLGSSFKALLITGDTSSSIRKLTQDSDLRMISKPVDADEMLSLIETLLAS